MRKLVLISLISLLFLGSQVSAEVIRSSNFYNEDTLEEMEHEFYTNGMLSDKKNNDITTDSTNYYESMTGGGGGRTSTGMPLFKKIRIKLQNRYRIKEHEEQLKLEAEREAELKLLKDKYNTKELSDEEIDELLNRNLKKVYLDEDGNVVEVSAFDKFKSIFKRKKKNVETEENKAEVLENESSENGDKILSGGVSEVIAEKDMILDCDKLNYDDETSELEALGNPVMSFPPQNTTIKARRITYNKESNIIKAYDDVEIIKNGDVITGDFIMINLNDESSVLTNMNTKKMNIQVNAKDVVASEDAIELRDGSLQGDQHYILVLKSTMVGPLFDNHDIADDDRSSISKGGLEINVNAKDIYVTAKKKHNVITVKDADIYYKDNYITHVGSFSAHTNKENEYFEANYPEFGNMPRVGMFIGPGFVFDIPNGATIKAIPFLNYRSKIGVGGALKYRSGTNYTEMFYGTSMGNFVAKGYQSLDDRLYLQYGVNSYLDEWWLGSTLAKYRAELVYNDSTIIPDTLGEGRSANYRQRISAGYMHEANFNRDGEHFSGSELGTTRLKYMAQLSQSLFNYQNKKNLAKVNLSFIMQGSAGVYGTGDTQFIGRMGPFLHTQYKRWSQDLGYLLGSAHDNTPMPKMDAYRLGASSVFFRESIRFNKYITLSWMGSAALSNDTPNNRLFQENGFYLALGPDDLRLIFGYDFIREASYLMFSTALDTKGSKINYKKMVIKNPEKLSNQDQEKVVPITFDDGKPQKIRRAQAQVIEIEDPDREQL